MCTTSTQLPDLLHGNEQRAYGDSSYASQQALIRAKAPQASDFTNQRVLKGGEIDEAQRRKNQTPCRTSMQLEFAQLRLAQRSPKLSW